MKKIVFLLLLDISIHNLFSQEENICKEFINDNFKITNYSSFKIPIICDGISTYLFYDNIKNDILVKNINSASYITNGIILSLKDNKVIQYIEISSNGVIKTKDSMLFDFSGSEYNNIKFIGWIVKVTEKQMDNHTVLICNFQLTNNKLDQITTDPPLSNIYLYSRYNYPVIYNYSYSGLKIKSSFNEDKLISIARAGLLQESELFEPQITYDEINKYSDAEKRILRNALFALYGYSFASEDLTKYFNRFFWYKPDKKIKNDINILDENQRRLLIYLNKKET